MDNNTNFFERILQIIEYYKINSVNDFALNYLKYSSSEKINRLKRKNTNPSYDIILDITNKFEEVSSHWLITGKGSMLKEAIPKDDQDIAIPATLQKGPDIKPIPFVEQRVVAGFGNADFSIADRDVKDYYVVPKFKHHKIDFMIEIYGSSMYPKYNSGDVVACRIIRESKFIQWNKVHVIATSEQGLLVKRIKKGPSITSITVISDNPNYDPFDIPIEEITGIAIVVGVIRIE